MARLIYLMGPSGAGKDSLLRELRRRAEPGECLLVAHRYITRPADAGGENHVAVTREEFEQRLRAGLFALSWDSHGYRYGIGTEIDHWLDLGFDVAVNGSRAYLAQASERYPSLLPVLIEVSPAVLRQRMGQRGRESGAEIDLRLARGHEYAGLDGPGVVRLDNDGPIADSARRLRALLRAASAPGDTLQTKENSTTSAR